MPGQISILEQILNFLYALSAWTGDQTVTWNPDLGLPSAITASLALGMSGYPFAHSDIGGYQSIIESVQRSEKLLLRWAEMNVFSTAMRSHEGNGARLIKRDILTLSQFQVSCFIKLVHRPSINAQLYAGGVSYARVSHLARKKKHCRDWIREK